MSWWYEFARLLGVNIERKEVERILEGEADTEERRDLITKLKKYVEHKPKWDGYKTLKGYDQAVEDWKKAKIYYNQITENKPET